MSQFTVAYERKLSDGQYGSEGVALTYTADYADDDLMAIEERTDLIATILRQAVLGQLASSAARNVALVASRELAPPQLASTAVTTSNSEDMEDLPF